MKDLITSIENLYETFGGYSTQGIHYCKCGCIDEKDVEKLASKTLRELEQEDLISYHGSALYTWGEVEHYKHFLPRICELISKYRDFSYVTLDELFAKLEYAEWTKWPENEQQALREYVVADWIDFSNKNQSEINLQILEVYGKFIGIKEVLKLWDISNSEEGIRNFVYFFYWHGSQILSKGVHISETKYEIKFRERIQAEGLISKLENLFFKTEDINPDYADKISVVLQMLEQEIKANMLK